MQAEDDDDEAGDDGQLRLVGLDPLAEHRCAGAEPTNTVVKPSTKNTEASTTRRHRRGVDPVLVAVICSMVVPPR